jgi:O-antigen ligase
MDIQRHPLNRAHDRLALTLALLVPLTSIPLASNRSSWWLMWTMVLAFLAMYHVWRTGQLERSHRLRFLRFRVGFLLALVLPFWALVQTVPLGPLQPFLPSGLLAMREGLSDLVGTRISVQADVAMSGILRFIGYLLLLALVLEVATRGKRVLRLATLVFAGVVIQAVWAIVALKLLNDFSFLGPKTAYEGVATGTFINRNSLATFLGFGVILGIGILVERADQSRLRSSRKLNALNKLGFAGGFILLGIFVQLAAILATQSRLGLASTVVAMIATVLLARRRAGLSTRRLVMELLVLMVIAVLGLVVLGGGEGVMTRALFASSEGQVRLSLYEQTLGMIQQRPLTGFGMDSFGFAFEAFRAPPLVGVGAFDLAHNSYLMLWAEFGLVVGSIPPLLLTAAAVVLWRQMVSPRGFSGLALAGIGVLVLGAVHSLGDFSLEIPANVYLFVTIIGLGLGQRKVRKPVEAALFVPSALQFSAVDKAATGTIKFVGTAP